MGLNYPEGLTGGFGNILCSVVIEWTLQQHKQTSKKRTLATTSIDHGDEIGRRRRGLRLAGGGSDGDTQ